MPDPCLTATHDAVLGTLIASSSAHVMQSAAVPAGVVTVAQQGTATYGLFSDKKVKSLGAFPTLATGAALADVTTTADRTANVFLGGYLASSGHHLVAGYTRADFSGTVALIDAADAGVQYLDAPGNFTAAGFSDGFIVNSLGLATLTGAAGYALNTTDGGISSLAAFDMTWMGSSGFTAVTNGQVLLLGYYGKNGTGTAAMNRVRAAPPAQYTPALQSGTPFMLAQSTEVASGADVVDIGVLGTDLVVVHGGYTAGYDSYTSKVERIPLIISSSSVTAGTPVTLFSSTDQCTSAAFNAASGADLLVGIKDKNGTRLVRLTP